VCIPLTPDRSAAFMMGAVELYDHENVVTSTTLL